MSDIGPLKSEVDICPYLSILLIEFQTYSKFHIKIIKIIYFNNIVDYRNLIYIASFPKNSIVVDSFWEPSVDISTKFLYKLDSFNNCNVLYTDRIPIFFE